MTLPPLDRYEGVGPGNAAGAGNAGEAPEQGGPDGDIGDSGGGGGQEVQAVREAAGRVSHLVHHELSGIKPDGIMHVP